MRTGGGDRASAEGEHHLSGLEASSFPPPWPEPGPVRTPRAVYTENGGHGLHLPSLPGLAQLLSSGPGDLPGCMFF